jgi:multimeric flavodoxin WrbA
MRDGLTAILEKIENADAIILGSPIYLGNVTGEMRSFFERMIFPYLVYNKDHSTIFTKNMKNGWIYHEHTGDLAQGFWL